MKDRLQTTAVLSKISCFITAAVKWLTILQPSQNFRNTLYLRKDQDMVEFRVSLDQLADSSGVIKNIDPSLSYYESY